MGDSPVVPKFGEVHLDIEDVSLRPAFGEVEFPEPPPSSEEEPPPSTSRVFGPQAKTRGSTAYTRAKGSNPINDQATRIVAGDALANITRPPPPMPGEEAPPSVPSGSGVASSRGDAVAAMRELYAKGDAAGALMLASTLDSSPPPAAGADYPDASIVVEFGPEEEIEIDSYEGLAPNPSSPAHRAITSPPRAITLPPPLVSAASGTAPQLTLTERQSIVRLTVSLAELPNLKIDHRAGFLLAHVDGMHTLEEILDICAMPATEALELIASLRAMGVIDFE